MATKTNVFDHDTLDFFNKMADLENLFRAAQVYLGRVQHEAYYTLEEKQEEAKASGQFASNVLGLSTRIYIPDITGNDLKRLSYETRHNKDRDVLLLMAEVMGRAQAQALSAAYEVFEHYLKVVAPILFFHAKHHRLHHEKRLQKSDKYQNIKKLRGTSIYFQTYVKVIASYNCNELIDEILAILPKLDQLSKSNPLGDLRNFQRIISGIRHASVHSHGELSRKAKLSQEARQYIEAMMIKSPVTGRMTIVPNSSNTERILYGIMAFVYAFYVVASETYGMTLADFHHPN